MKNYLFGILLLLFIGFFTALFSQDKAEFTQAGFLNEVKAIYGKSKNKNDKLFLGNLSSVWNSNSYSEEQKADFVEMAILLRSKKGRNYPQLKNYFNCIISFSGKTSLRNFPDWKRAMTDYLSDDKISLKSVNELLLFTINLLEENLLNKNYAVSWKTSSEDISFNYNGDLWVNVGKGNLICFSGRDSIVIYNTSGKYLLSDKNWLGTNGKVSWERAGFSTDSVYALLSEYDINLTGPEYNIDTVNFIHKKYFTEPVRGKLFDKVKYTRKPENATYPQFDSFDKKNKIKDVFPKLDFEGGYTLNGSRMIGSGDLRNDAFLFWHKDNRLFLKLASKKFSFDNFKVVSNNTEMTFYIGQNDSVFHPGLQFAYSDKMKKISFVRDGGGKANSPFFNSYHKLDMLSELMTWQVNDSVIYLGTIPGSIEDESNFESSYYYTEKRYAEIQNLDRLSPLYILEECAKSLYGNSFTIQDLAYTMKKSLPLAKQMALNLSIGGFISYDEGKNIIEINQRTWDYLDYVAGRKDHDVIEFKSNTGQGKTNAKLFLNSLNLEVDGVSRVILSKVQNLYIYPNNNTILIKKNLDIVFDGLVKTALIDFSGRTFYFDYDGFEIKMDTIDYVKMKAPGKVLNNKGQAVLQDISSILENLSGVLYIDSSNNKSGFNYLPWYPIFKSLETAYIYYDQKSILNGAYPREKFFFQIDSFAIDSLNNLEKEGVIRFPGQFVTNVFPPIEAELSLQDDFSLGFELTKTPVEGYPLYGGKGRFFNNLSMSNKGLRGDGELHYLTSITSSNDFLFFPDSMKVRAQEFNVTAQNDSIKYPPVSAKNLFIQWYPNEDEFIASALRDSISVFGEANLAGRIYLLPDGMEAKGLLDFGDFELNSDRYKLSNRSFDSDKASFRIKSADGSEFQSNDTKAHFDLDRRIGEFQPNINSSAINFPANLFTSSPGLYVYDMDSKNVQIKNSLFTSTDPGQNNLNFTAGSSEYDKVNNRIITRDVDSIVVGDVYIIPDKKEVIIENGGKLQKLNNATIIIDKEDYRHEIFNAVVNINGSNSYTAEGDYIYTDQAQRKDTIHFNSIGINSTGASFARGQILVDEKFNLSPAFEFTGEAILNSGREFMTFKGFFKLIHDCLGISKNWIKFESEIDPENLKIAVNRENYDINSVKVHNSFFLSNVNPEIYPSFMSINRQFSDNAILSTQGYLIFDNNTQEFLIADEKKLEDVNSTGSLISLNRQNCELKGEGLVNFGVELGQVKLSSAGNISHKLTDKSSELNVILGLDFYFPDDALKIIAETINKTPNISTVDVGSQFYRKSLNELVGAETANKVLGGGGLDLFNKIPNEIKHSIFFTELNLLWNKETGSYQAINNLNIGNINATPVNKIVQGYFEITKKRSGDIISLYFEIDPNTWFFFQYSRGMMQSISSNEKYNKIITNTKPEKQKQKVDPGQAAYQFYISTNRLVDRFKEKFAK